MPLIVQQSYSPVQWLDMVQRTNKESQEAVGSVEQVSTETDHRNLSAFHTEPNQVHLGCELMKIKGLIRIILSAD